MRTTLSAILVATTVFLGLGTSGCGAGGNTGGCHLGMICTMYTGYGWTGIDVSDRCGGMGAEIVDECPQEDLLGTCTLDVNEERETTDYFYSPYFTLAVAEQECTSLGGIWAPAG